ncbi:MAG: protein translocase subunit SecD [Acidobacteriota bacterium]
MNSNVRNKLLITLAVTLACIYGIIGLPTSIGELKDNFSKRINLGLDLRGGTQLVMQIQLQDAFKAEADTVIQRLRTDLSAKHVTYADINRNDPQTIEDAGTIAVTITGVPGTQGGDLRTVINDGYGSQWSLTTVNATDYRLNLKTTEFLGLKEATLSQTMNTIEKKINGLGLAESSVQRRGGTASEAEILVQLPGVDDPARIKSLLTQAAVLELFEVQDGPFSSREEVLTKKGGFLGLGSQILPTASKGAPVSEFWLLKRTPEVTGRDLRNSQAQQNATTRTWETTFVLTQEAAKRFEKFTGDHIGKRLAIVMDHKVLSAPTIEAKIGDNGVINNIGTREDAADLALNLRSGSLPAGLKYIEERSVGPSLGADSIRSGLMAGVVGLVAVVLVMLVYYKKAGVNATIALLLNAVILLAMLTYFHAVLTLPGIAGIILTIGMAVDSNVLIFERIREELRNGKAAMAAMDAGFDKALLTIIDTHLTTMVSCAFLFLFGTGPVKGFAVTLVIGLAANFFTAVFVSRALFEWELGGSRKVDSISI